MPLRLVPLSGRHARGLRALAANEPIARGLSVRALASRDEILGFIVRAQRLRARDAGAVFAVCADDGLLGLVALTRGDEAPGQAELGFWIAPPFRGRGHATSAARHAVAHGFDRLRLVRIVARCPSANRASIRVLDKLGLRFAGLEALDPTGTGDALGRYELGREEWRAGLGR